MSILASINDGYHFMIFLSQQSEGCGGLSACMRACVCGGGLTGILCMCIKYTYTQSHRSTCEWHALITMLTQSTHTTACTDVRRLL